MFSAVVACLQTLAALWISLGFSLVLLAASRPPLQDLGKRLLVVNLFIAFLWLFLPWSMPGKELFHAGPLTVSSQGAKYALMLTVRSNALVIALIAFMATTSIASTTHAMNALRIPVKITCLFFFTYRYIQDISSEYSRLTNAMRMRCFLPRTDLHTYRSYAYLVGMLLVNSYDRALRVRMAMVCRGFSGRYPCLDRGRISGLDVLALFVLCVILAGILYADT